MTLLVFDCSFVDTLWLKLRDSNFSTTNYVVLFLFTWLTNIFVIFNKNCIIVNFSYYLSSFWFFFRYKFDLFFICFRNNLINFCFRSSDYWYAIFTTAGVSILYIIFLMNIFRIWSRVRFFALCRDWCLRKLHTIINFNRILTFTFTAWYLFK